MKQGGEALNSQDRSNDRVFQNRLRETLRHSHPTLENFLNSVDEMCTIEQDVTFDDVQHLRQSREEIQVIKNPFGIFSWKGDEDHVRMPSALTSNRVLERAMNRSRIQLDMHNHPSSVFTDDLSYPSPVDLLSPRVHNMTIVGEKGISVSGPLLRDPNKGEIGRFVDTQLMYGAFLHGSPHYYSNQNYDGNDWKRFIDAAGVTFSFYPWEDRSGIEQNVLNAPEVDASSKAWINSDAPEKRMIALRIFSSEYYWNDFINDSKLFDVYETFLADSNETIREVATSELARIKENIEWVKINRPQDIKNY